MNYTELENTIKAKYPILQSVSIIRPSPELGTWFTPYQVSIRTYSTDKCNYAISNFSIRNTPFGCGSALFHGWIGISNFYNRTNTLGITEQEWSDMVVDVFNILIDTIRVKGSSGVGVLIATAGDGYWTSPGYKFITEILGFKAVDEYQNHQHGTGRQRLLSLHI